MQAGNQDVEIILSERFFRHGLIMVGWSNQQCRSASTRPLEDAWGPRRLHILMFCIVSVFFLIGSSSWQFMMESNDLSEGIRWIKKQSWCQSTNLQNSPALPQTVPCEHWALPCPLCCYNLHWDSMFYWGKHPTCPRSFLCTLIFSILGEHVPALHLDLITWFETGNTLRCKSIYYSTIINKVRK